MMAPSSPPSSIDTPSFEPNIPPWNLPPEYVSMKSVLASLSRKMKRPPTLDDIIIPELDFSSPISSLMKVGTSRSHVQAEHSDGAKALVKGELGLQEYIRWLAILWRVYSALELSLSEHATNPVLAPTYAPEALDRAPALARDIIFLLDLLPSKPKQTIELQPPEDAPLPPFPIPDFMMPVFTLTPPPLATYITHLRDLALTSEDAPLLLAHSYVRYLGDLSGGQIIASRIRKAYDLHGDQGLAFYKFEMMGDYEPMKIHQMKEWFREAMNSGVQNDEVLKERLVKEANLAFALNVHLFALIQTSNNALVLSSPGTSAVAIPKVNAQGQPLRYYEIQQMERDAKFRAKKEKEALLPPITWKDRIERFSLFMLAVGVTLGFSKYGWPWMLREIVPRVRDIADERGWMDHTLVAKLLAEDGLLAAPVPGIGEDSAINSAGAFAKDGVKRYYDKAASYVDQLRRTAGSTASSVTSAASETYSQASTSISQVVQEATRAIEESLPTASEEVDDDIFAEFHGAYTQVSQAVDSATEVVKSATESVKEAIPTMPPKEEIVENLMTHMEPVEEAISTVAVPPAQEIFDQVRTPVEAVKTAIPTPSIPPVERIVEQVTTQVESVIEAIPTPSIPPVEQIIQQVTTPVESVMDAIPTPSIPPVEQIIEQVTTPVESVIDAIPTLSVPPFDQIVEQMSTQVESVKEAIPTSSSIPSAEEIVDQATTWVEAVKEAIPTPSISEVKEMVEPVTSQYSSVTEAVKDYATGVVTGASEVIQTTAATVDAAEPVAESVHTEDAAAEPEETPIVSTTADSTPIEPSIPPTTLAPGSDATAITSQDATDQPDKAGVPHPVPVVEVEEHRTDRDPIETGSRAQEPVIMRDEL
ncbi:hypothetical protein BD324DRAFT_322560 [Kockovaella imperatae]|uniref:Heme oxygenase-like protein n=1 Tax=Kockovaella imperatae TaxID=4999 RepID=A0A1Y1UMJ0_9TREE|nr:hypothetical protein BD324DRAFT_322560 [Kockovaella imperatae]ORX39273.1 hypothetical protein BD324DRAFT_322560 [Kockovaella imperatae]